MNYKLKNIHRLHYLHRMFNHRVHRGFSQRTQRKVATDYTDFTEKVTAKFAKVCVKYTKKFATDLRENKDYFTDKEYLI